MKLIPNMEDLVGRHIMYQRRTWKGYPETMPSLHKIIRDDSHQPIRMITISPVTLIDFDGTDHSKNQTIHTDLCIDAGGYTACVDDEVQAYQELINKD